ncbi:hypothetical protein N9903_01535 [bacterium]|nr:hypothetical protein [bacterium]
MTIISTWAREAAADLKLGGSFPAIAEGSPKIENTNNIKEMVRRSLPGRKYSNG